ncbi:hypothetical protein BH11CYA1_BH11CYA1_20820 [soil metagenome]
MPLDRPDNSLLAQPDGNSSFENVAKVTARTLSQTPSAFYDEISRDISQRPADALTRVAGGAAIGAVGTVLLKNQKVALVAAVAGLSWQGYEAVSSLSGFVSKAAVADNDAARERLAAVSSHNLGRSLTNFTESAPGMLLGGYGASRAFGAPPLYGRIGSAVEEKMIMPVRDRLAFVGPGSERLPASLLGKDLQGKATVDALELSRILGEKHPWKGVETGQTLDLASLKLSRSVVGKEETMSWLPGTTKPGKIPFHIHGPEARVGARPSLDDLLATRGLGIIKQGDQVAFYAGQFEQVNMMKTAGKLEFFQPSMRTVVVDHATQTARSLSGSFDRSLGWQMNETKHLDYQGALKALKALDLANPLKALEAF